MAVDERDRRQPRVTEEDKRRMRVLARDLREAEVDTLVEGEALRSLIEWANEQRAKLGIPPLDVDHDDDEPGEVELFKRAKALGMVRPSREDR